MQFRILTAAVVFLGSYLPLSLILLAQSLEYDKLDGAFCWNLGAASCELPLRSPIFSVVMVIVTLSCLMITILALHLIRPSQAVNVSTVKYIPSDLMNYTLPYIVSFMSIDYQDIGKFVGLSVFLIWMFWISYRSGQIIMNPVLIALGWRLYEIEFRFVGGEAKHVGRGLSRGHLQAGDACQATLQDIQIFKP
jgi:hypothetical protein